MHVPLSPVRFLYRAMDLWPKKTGVVSGPCRLTYAELGERCERLAGGLLAAGIRPGDRVAFLSFNNNQLLEGYFGVPLTRAIVMPLNVRLTPVELTGILNHAEPRVLIYEEEFTSTVDQLRSRCPSVERWVRIGEPYEELLSRERLDRQDIFTFDESAICELFYTSGSTGTPKGVMLSHRTLHLHALAAGSIFIAGGRDVDLHTIPLYHANGWGHPHCATANGLKQVMVRRFDPAQVLQLIQAEGATIMALVPTMANALLNCPALGQYDVSSMREITLGGAAPTPELIARLEQAFHCTVQGTYGLTETSPVATSTRHKSTVEYRDEDDRLTHLARTGWPVPGSEIRVVDLAGRDVPRDMQSVGEIAIRGDLVMDGYYKDPQATQSVLPDGWLRTGDVAVWDEENYIQIVDRKKDIIVSGGENISSIEVERAISAHPAVMECAVVAAPDEKWGEAPAAFIVLKPGKPLDQAGLSEFLGGRLAGFKMPRRYQFLEGPLPKTGTGKILKRELRETFWAGRQRRIQG